MAIFCVVVAGVAPSSAPAAEGAPSALLLRATFGAAIAAAHAAPALRGLEGSLLFLGAHERGQSSAERRASRAQAKPRPAAEQPFPEKEGSPPGSLPPASAGTNGAYVPPAAAGARRLTTRTPTLNGADLDGSSATYVSGIVLPPNNAPEAIKGVINAANTIVGKPYIWGGGHGSWYAPGYDCSGAVSFALAGGGFLSAPLDSGQLEHWGSPGPGRWLTVYANSVHAFAIIAGFRWDTVGDARGTGPRWHPVGGPPPGFVARHVPGY